LTFQEWLEDFASDETKKIGEVIIAKEILEIEERIPKYFSSAMFESFKQYHARIKTGERDLCF
jgi:2-iminoacetate synthase